MALIRVGKKSDIPVGGAVSVVSGDLDIAVFNAGGAFRAMDNLCPHRGAPLSDGRLEGGVVTCPWHGWQFDVATGALLMNPQTCQKTYPVVEKGEDLYVEA